MNESLPKHQRFSIARVTTIAGITLTELVRLKVFYILLLFGILLIGGSFYVGELNVIDQFQALKDMSLGSMTIFTWLLGLLATAMLIPKDLEDRTLYTILAKPVHRHEYLLGKLFGVLVMLLLALLAMTAVFLLVLYIREATALRTTALEYAQADKEVLADEIARIKAATFNWNLLPGIASIYIKNAMLTTLTLLISTFATSWIFTVNMSVLIYFIGNLQSVAREAWETAVSPLARIFLGLVALLFPDLQLFNLTDDVVVGVAIPAAIFFKTLGLGAMYFVIYLLLAQFIFSTREL